MVGLVLLAAIIAGIVYAVQAAQKGRPGGSTDPAAPGTAAPGASPLGNVALPPPPTAALARQLESWVAAGLLTEPQSAAILAHEAALTEAHAASLAAQPPPAAPVRPRRVPVVAEALGYLGGALAITGLGLVVSRVWPDLSLGGKLGLSGVTAVLLVAGGLLVRDQSDAALVRLRAVLWLASSAATGLFAGVVARDGFDVESAVGVALAVAAAVTLQSGALWRGVADRPIQQATALVATVVTMGTAVGQFLSPGSAGIAIAVAGAVLLFVGLRRLSPEHALTELVGSVSVVAGALIVAGAWTGPGLVAAVAVAFGLLALATVPRVPADHTDRLVFGLVGGITLLQSAPSTIGFFATEQDAPLATGLVTWVVGAALLAIGARRLVLAPHAAAALGAAALIGGAALTAGDAPGFATIFGFTTALGLIALGMLPGQVLLSVFGSIGLLVNVPWAISWFFPGEGRVPILILVSGVLILGIAVLLTRMGPRFRHDLASPPRPPVPTP